MTFENDDTFLNTPRHTSGGLPMNKALSDWLTKRMTQIDERIAKANGRIYELEEE